MSKRRFGIVLHTDEGAKPLKGAKFDNDARASGWAAEWNALAVRYGHPDWVAEVVPVAARRAKGRAQA